MNIALDWDNTYTRDTHDWQRFIELFEGLHNIWIVTSRGEDTPIEFIPDYIEGVVYCNYRAKKLVTEKRGIKIDIWIDDDPKWIEEGFVESDIDFIEGSRNLNKKD